LFSTQVHVTLMWLFVGAWARNWSSLQYYPMSTPDL
jgi:hypothetical protein